MTAWKKAGGSFKYGVVVYHFKMKGDHLLPLTVGDTVVIVEESGDWYRGYHPKSKTNIGLFPKSYVHLRDATLVKSGSLETVIPKEPAISQEITSVVREWYLYWKNLYVEGDQEFNSVQQMIHDLLAWRKDIMSRKVTTEQMKDLKQKVSAKIDSGNALLGLDLVVRYENNIFFVSKKLLGLDLVVRDDEGNVLTSDRASLIKIYREHVEVADRIKQEKIESPPDLKGSVGVTYNLYVMLRNFVCRVDDVEILVNLYDAKTCNYICENYIVKWEMNRISKDPDFLSNLRVVFTDLDAKDREREKVYLVLQIVRCGVMDHKDAEDKKQTKGLRRPFGAAAMDITEWLQGSVNTPGSEDTQHFVPFLQCGDKESMESCVKKTVTVREINHKGQGLWVSLKLLKGDIKQIREDCPHLVQPSTTVVRKMGFPDVIMPGDVRNDIYVTIIEGEFNRGSKTADKNVEVTMLVCNKQGEPLTGVINPGCGCEGTSEHKTIIYYHEDRPKWYEIVKVAVSTELEFKGLHLKFLFKHKSRSETKDKNEKPFAMAFIKLLNKNGTTLMDKEHDLLLYKIDHRQKEERKMFNAYLDLPSTITELEATNSTHGTGQFSASAAGTHSRLPKIPLFCGPYSLSYKDSFKIKTYVCSTKLTHNVDLLGLLRWQEVMSDQTLLKRHLEHLMRVDGEEIVKFLQDLLDSLFYILMHNTVSDLYDNLVFDALVNIIGLVAESRYYHFRPILDAYIQSFSLTTAYNKLMVILKEYIDQANEDTEHEPSFRQAMKSLEYIFKFIIRSRELFAMLNENRGRQQFEIMLKQLIESIGGLMLHTSDRTVRAQGYALRNMPLCITDILKVFNAVELSHLFVNFLNHVPKQRLRIQKIKCIEDLVSTELFQRPDCREVLLPMMLSTIHNMMEAQDEMSACIKVLSNIMDTLFSPTKQIFHDKDIDTLMEKILRTVIQTTIRTHAGDCVAVLLSILQQMTEVHYNNYINTFHLPTDLGDFLMEIMMLFQNLINTSVFQGDWMEMIMLQNSIILRALRFFAQTINQKFSNPFEQQLWNNFFHCAISFLTQDFLQLENFSASKRNKIISRYNDMRREMGFEIRSMWSNLGQNKVYFVPEMVGPLLEMTLIPETELRKATIPIFFDMMMCEYNQAVTRGHGGNFKQVENEMINQLDVLIEGGRGDEQYMELFRDILSHSCKTHESIRDQGLAFVDTITKLLQRLLEYRHIIQDEIKDHRMSCIVNLLDFYNSINRQEMYVRYLHKLCTMHLECDNYTEAAHTLLLYAKLLDWSDEGLPTHLFSERFPEAQTHRGLKEMLYHHTIQYFEKGKMWERGIDLCKELAQMYENELFDYEKLSWILKRQAGLFECIMKEMRPDPEYFRVGYFGKGFPSFLQNKVLIYRGKEYERLQDFNSRMQILFPNAEFMKTLSAPSEDLKESQKQYLQVNAVTPVMDMHQKFLNKQVSEKILKYYNFNEVQLFTFSRRIDEGGSDITNIWQEKTNLTTKSPLPGILCWFEVTQTIVYKVSPIEYAIETMETTIKKLNSGIEHQLTDEKARVDQLGMLLNGIVDAAVNGGISNWKSFYAEEFPKTDRDKDFQKTLRDLTKQQSGLLRDALWIHKKKVTEQLKPFHAHMEQRFAELQQMIEREYNLKVIDKTSSATNTLRRYQSQSVISLNRISNMFPTSPSAQASNGTRNGMKGFFKAKHKKPGDNKTSSVYATPVNPVNNAPPKPAQNRPSVWVKPEKNIKSTLHTKVNRKTKRSSQISTASSSDSPDSNRNSLENPIELNEQLTPKRPLRPEPDRERRNSQRLSATFRPDQPTLPESLDIETEEPPPPLPQKQSTNENNFNHIEPPPIPDRKASTTVPPKTPRKSKPLPSQSSLTDNGEISSPSVPEKLTPFKPVKESEQL